MVDEDHRFGQSSTSTDADHDERVFDAICGNCFLIVREIAMEVGHKQRIGPSNSDWKTSDVSLLV